MNATGHLMNKLAKFLVLSVCVTLPLPSQAQILYRGSSSAAEVGAITYRTATTGVSGGIIYRGFATTGTTSFAPVYRASTSSSAASGALTLTIARPATTVENDVMVAAIGVSANTPTITAPAGWTLVRQMNNSAVNANSQAIFIKVATAAEPFSYSWALSASAGSVGGIQTYYNVDISNPVDAENGQTTASSLTHTAPTITSTVANTMLVGHYTISSAANWAAQNPPGPPVTMTESYDIANLTVPTANGQSLQGTRTLQAVAGLSAAYASRASANVDTGNAHILALRPALRVPRPALTAPSDFMLAAIGVQPSTATLTPPAGWTLVTRIDNAGPTSNALVIYRKFAVAGEPASYLWQVAGATAVVGGIQSYVGVDPLSPVDVESGAATPNSLTHTAPAITTTVANAMLVGHYTFASARTWTAQNPPGPPVAMTESYDVASRALNAAGQSLEGTRQLQAAAGASVAFASTASADADAGVAHMMALRPAGTQISIATPTGVTANDVLIAAIGLTPSSVTITPPAGWVSVRRTNNTNGVSNALQEFYKVATSTEPAGHTWTFSGNASAVGGIQAYIGVDTISPVNVESGATTGSSVDHAAPTITTTVANTMLVGHYTFSSSASWGPRNPPGPPVAMTESYDILFPPAGATGQALEGTRQLQATAGLSTAFTSRASANADFGNTHLLALRPQLGSNIELPLPLGTVEDDVMIAAIGYQPNTLTITPPAGWTLVGGSSNAAATANSLAVYQHIAGAAEPALYQWTFSGSALAAAGGMQVFSGVDTTTPIDVSAGQATGNSLNHATPSITTTVANTMLVAAHTFASSATWAPPAGMTEAYDRANLNTGNAAGQSIEGSYVAQAAIGATGTKTATASANADRGNTYIIALRPAPTTVQPSSFNGCESATCTPVATPLTYAALYTKLAGTAFTLQGVALNTTGTLEATFNGDVTVDLLANINAGVALSANNCPTSQNATVALGTVTFASGRVAITGINAGNAYRDVRMRFTCSAAECGSLITQCSTDNFAVRPNGFTVTSTTANADLTGTSFAAVPAVKAGATFNLTATALAAYDGIPSVNAALLTAHAGAIQNGTLGGNFTAAASGTGVATGNFSYSEVGYFNLATNGVYDDTYTGVDQPNDCTNDFSNTAVGGKYGCSFGNTAATNYFGRFVPDHFGLATGLLIDRADINTGVSESVCGSSFTYMGEDFKTSFTLLAQNTANATTQNYTGSHARFGLTTWNNYTFTGSSGTLIQGSVAPTGAWVSIPTTPTTYGTAVIMATHQATRSTAAPVAPYTAFSVSAAPSYTDGAATIAIANTAVHAGSSEQRYGRLKLFNAYGSDLLNLPVPIQTQYWDGAAFLKNSSDNCTSLIAGNINLNVPPAGVSALVGGTFTSGVGAITLSKPTVPAQVIVNLCADLGVDPAGGTVCVATSAAKPYLQSLWAPGGNYDNDPVARATFGIYQGKNLFIYQRENY